MRYFALFFLIAGYTPVVFAVGTWGSVEQREWIASLVPDLNLDVDSVRVSPVDDWYEVIVNPRDILYISSDGKHIFLGNLFDVRGKENLTEGSRASVRARMIENIGEDKMITFVPDNAKYVLTVFTDVECPHCRKLHSQIKEYNALGIGIRYLFFPRSGYPSSAWDKSINVWCSENREGALSRAKKDQPIPQLTCADSPVELHYNTGRMFGINGTPAIFFEDGKYLSGYLPPERLLEYLDKYSTQ